MNAPVKHLPGPLALPPGWRVRPSVFGKLLLQVYEPRIVYDEDALHHFDMGTWRDARVSDAENLPSGGRP